MFIIGMRMLILIGMALFCIYMLLQLIKSVHTSKVRKENLTDALAHINDTIIVGEGLPDVNIERLRKAQEKINMVLNAEKKPKKQEGEDAARQRD